LAVRLVPAIVDPSATGWCETAGRVRQPRKRPVARKEQGEPADRPRLRRRREQSERTAP